MLLQRYEPWQRINDSSNLIYTDCGTNISNLYCRVGVAFDAWMWPLHKEKDLPNEIDQPLLFINMEHFQTAKNLKTMKQFAESDVAERRVVTIR